MEEAGFLHWKARILDSDLSSLPVLLMDLQDALSPIMSATRVLLDEKFRFSSKWLRP